MCEKTVCGSLVLCGQCAKKPIKAAPKTPASIRGELPSRGNY